MTSMESDLPLAPPIDTFVCGIRMLPFGQRPPVGKVLIRCHYEATLCCTHFIQHTMDQFGNYIGRTLSLVRSLPPVVLMDKCLFGRSMNVGEKPQNDT